MKHLMIAGLLFSAVLSSIPVQAQEGGSVAVAESGVQLTLGGTFQGRASYAHRDETHEIGVGIRRMRFRASADIDGTYGAHLDVNATGGSVTLVDGFGRISFGDSWRIRLGRFIVPQPRAGNLTSHVRIDAAERPAIAEMWLRNLIAPDGRDFGVDIQYARPHFAAEVAVHSGDNRLGNFRPVPWEEAARYVESPFAAGAAARYTLAAIPALEFGGHVTYNRNPPLQTQVDLDYAAGGSAHLYWGADPGSQPIRLKTDVIYTHLARDVEPATEWGFSLLGAARLIDGAEIFARAERLLSDLHQPDDAVNFFTAGGHLSISALQGAPFYRQRITLAAAAQERGAGFVASMVSLQLQLVF